MFYFRFIAPHLQNIEKGLTNTAIDDLRSNFDAYIGKNAFEEICREWVSSKADKKELSFEPKDIGEYWDRDMQIDIFGMNRHDQMMIVGEAKWSNKKTGVEALQELERKAKVLNKKNNYFYQLALFSRAEFTPQLAETARKRKILLVLLSDIL
jgi:AAA+ ATPase superfamily predicted ATPase